jgi:hypothetical protein
MVSFLHFFLVVEKTSKLFRLRDQKNRNRSIQKDGRGMSTFLGYPPQNRLWRGDLFNDAASVNTLTGYSLLSMAPAQEK